MREYQERFDRLVAAIGAAAERFVLWIAEHTGLSLWGSTLIFFAVLFLLGIVLLVLLAKRDENSYELPPEKERWMGKMERRGP